MEIKTFLSRLKLNPLIFKIYFKKNENKKICNHKKKLRSNIENKILHLYKMLYFYFPLVNNL